MRLLEAAGYVHIAHHGTLLISPTPRATRYTSGSRRSPLRHQVGHHVAVLRILDGLQRRAEAAGGRVLPIELHDGRRVPFLLDRHIQNQARRRRGRTHQGDRLPGVPDGLLQVQLPGRPVEQVAVEYFTAKYSDAQIASKRELQLHYPRLVQVADSARTAHRVLELTGCECSVLSSSAWSSGSSRSE